MKANEIITEISRLHATDYTGGKDRLGDAPNLAGAKTLPGGSGFKYVISQDSYRMTISLVDPRPTAPKDSGPFRPPARMAWHTPLSHANRVRDAKAEWQAAADGGAINHVGELSLKKWHGPIKNAWRVDTVTVNEDYRKGGFGLSLYGIALTILKLTLIAGDSQTPGGRQNWVNLASIPGVEVKGIFAIDDSEFGGRRALPKKATNYAKNDYEDMQDVAQDNIEMLMSLGMQYIGKAGYANDPARYFAFDVVGAKGELAPAVANKLSKIYGNYATDLFARWVG